MHRTVSEQQLFKNGAQKQKFPIWKIPINLLHEVLRVTSNDVMLSAGEFSSSYAVLCTPSFTGGVRTTYPTSWGLSTSVVHAPAYTIFFSNELRDTAATDKMWRARLFSRWVCRVECSTGRHACCFWLCFL